MCWLFSMLIRSEVPNIRDDLMSYLLDKNIETRPFFYPMHKQPVYRNNVIAGDSLPVTEQVARELIALPVHPEMDDSQIDYVLTAIEDLF